MIRLKSNLKVTVVLFVFFLNLFTGSNPLASVVDPVGIWSLSGVHSEFGPYQGELEVSLDKDGNLSLIRLITYDLYRYKDLKVQEIWSGKGRFKNSHLEAHFRIKQADYIKTVDDLTRTPEQFQKPVHLNATFKLQKNSTITWILLNNSVTDHFDGNRRKLEAAPLWKDKRQRIYSQGKATSIAQSIAKFIVENTVIADYRKDPKVAVFADRSDFKQKAQYFIMDTTDYEFYQDRRDTLRIPNKIIDEISLVEELYRHSAYTYTLSEKAEMADEKMQQLHINEAGLFASAQVDENGDFVQFYSDNDGALWSGMYAGSQAMRYLTTKDPQALLNFKKTLKGMILLMDVTGDKRQFARTIQAFDPEKKLDKSKWKRGLGEYDRFSWKCCGNNDMVKGIFHAFVWASVVLPEDDELRPVLKSRARLFPDLYVVEESKQNRTVASGIAALWTRDQKYKETYFYGQTFLESIAEALGVANGFYVGGVADWSGINLGVVGLVTKVVLAQEMIAKFPSPPKEEIDYGDDYSVIDGAVAAGVINEEDLLEHAREAFLDTWNNYSAARRDLVTIAAYAFAYKEGTRGFGFGFDEEDLTREEEEKSWEKREAWDKTINQAVWSLREFSFPQHRYNVAIDFRLRPTWCLSAWPRLPWKSVKNKQPVEYHFQAVEDFPLFQSLIFDTNFFWKDGPFSAEASGSRDRIQPRADYLYAYWMSRWSGLLSEDDRWQPKTM